MSTNWTLLIYTVPAHPTRLRAAVWRDVKRAGATYLRDGVCILPESGQTVSTFQIIASQIESLGGEATVVSAATLEPKAVDEVVGNSRMSRAAEYAELARDMRSFLGYLRLETRHRRLGRIELARLERDLEKLRVWLKDVRSRDYFDADGRDHAEALLDQCSRELAPLLQGMGLGGKAA